MKRNPLDEIDGIGASKKRALLHAFGSARDVSRAAAQDLAKVERVSAALAQRISPKGHSPRPRRLDRRLYADGHFDERADWRVKVDFGIAGFEGDDERIAAHRVANLA